MDNSLNKKLEAAVLFKSDLQSVKLLLAQGADANMRTKEDHDTLLHYADTADIAKELISYGAAINAVNIYGDTPLHAAIIYTSDLSIVRVLLSSGADVNLCLGEEQKTALHYAKTVDITKELLNHGADVNARDSYGRTPLYCAIEDHYRSPHLQEQIEVVRELLRHGSDLYAKDMDGNTALFNAVIYSSRINSEVIWKLLVHEIIRPSNTEYYTLLDIVLKKPDLRCAKLLIRIIILKNFHLDYKSIIGLNRYYNNKNYSELSNYTDNCVREMVQMKLYKINNNISLYNFVRKIGQNVIPLYTSNKNILQDISRSYPIYCDIILSNMEMSIERGGLLFKFRSLQLCSESATNNLYAVLNPDCMYRISEYLSNNDLGKFIATFEKKSQSSNKVARLFQ